MAFHNERGRRGGEDSTTKLSSFKIQTTTAENICFEVRCCLCNREPSRVRSEEGLSLPADETTCILGRGQDPVLGGGSALREPGLLLLPCYLGTSVLLASMLMPSSLCLTQEAHLGQRTLGSKLYHPQRLTVQHAFCITPTQEGAAFLGNGLRLGVGGSLGNPAALAGSSRLFLCD